MIFTDWLAMIGERCLDLVNLPVSASVRPKNLLGTVSSDGNAPSTSIIKQAKFSCGSMSTQIIKGSG